MSLDGSSGIVAVDLFCGVGGLTHGLSNAGIDVKLGVDCDPACRFPMEANNEARFMEADVANMRSDAISDVFGGAEVSLLAGCAPCQPFSTYSQAARRRKRHDDWGLLASFSDLVLETEPTLVTMENVPPLRTQTIFKDFIRTLADTGYSLDWRVVDGRAIGLPQRRQRLVFVASKLGPICLPESDEPEVSVREAIGGLPPIEAGETHPHDLLHSAPSLSPLNLKRIRHSVPGGTWRDWPDDLVAACHTRKTGSTYPSVYGRMEWDKPAPTMTTQCYGFGNGRFGHPKQDRAISLREAAMIQSFPKEYAFLPETGELNFSLLGRLIGNAVPVRLGEYIGQVLVDHVKSFSKTASG